MATIHLRSPLPVTWCGLPAGSDEQSSIACAGEVLRRHPFGLAPGGVCRADRVTSNAGGLLHHRFTLAPTFVVAVYFLWHFPAGCPGWALPTTLPFGVRTFLDRHACRGRPADSSG